MAGKFNLAEHIQSSTPAVPRTIEVVTGELLEAKRVGGEAILTIGQRLIEAKALLPHGEWLPWLEGQVEFSERVAQQYMLAARKYSNPKTLADLGISKALALLALPDESRDQFISEPHFVAGEEKSVSDMTTRELNQTIRERNEARMAAEKAAADQKATEKARDEMARQMKVVNETLAEATRNLEQMQKELNELRERPVDVAVEQVPDPAAIEAARKEGIAEMQAKVDKAKAAKAKAEERRKAAEEDLAAANAKLKELDKEKKKESMAADTDLVVFQTLFDGVQEQVNKLHGYLLRYKNKGDTEMVDKLSRAMSALADKIKEAAGV